MALQLRRGTNAERLAITPQQGELIFVTDYLAVNITGITIASNVITFSANHGITVLNTKILYQGATGNGLTQGTVYYVKTIPSLTTLTLSTTSGGTTQTLTNATGQTLTFNKTPTLANGTPVGNVSPLWIGNGTTVGGVAAQVSVLNDLLDVTLASLEEGDTLYYDATTGQWKNTHILKIVDDTAVLDINTSANSRITMNSSLTNNPSAPLILRHTSTGIAGAGFGTTIGFEAETLNSGVKTIGYLDYQVSDSTAGSEDYQFGIGLMRAGVQPSDALGREFVVDSTGNITARGNLILKGEDTNDTWVDFVHPTKTGHLAWAGSGLFINGDFDVAGSGINGVANITAGSGTTMGIANIFNNANIGTVNLANGATKLNLGGLTAGTTTLVKSPQLNLVGDILVGSNEIKTGTYNSTTDVWTNEQTAILLNGIDVDVNGVLKVVGNKIRSSNADAIELSSSNVTVVGDLIVRGAGVQSDITAEKTIGTLFVDTPSVYVGTGSANTVVSIGGTNSTTTINHNAVVAGDLAVNGSNSDNAWATISTTNTQAEIFPFTATSINIGYDATSITMGAVDSGTTTIRNDLAVNGGDITTTKSSANIYNNDGISVVNIGNGVTNQVNIGNSLSGTVNIKSTSLLQNDLPNVSKTFNLFNSITETLNVGGAATAVNIGSNATGAMTTFNKNVTIAGSLTVNGTTTTINSTTLTVDDKNIELGSVATPSNLTATGGGITLLGGSDGDKTIVWNNSTDGFEINQAVKTTGQLNVNNKTYLYANTGDVRTGNDIYVGGTQIRLREAQTGTPASTNSTSIVVERGSLTDAALTFYEADDTWYFTNNAKIENDFTVIGATTLSGNTTMNSNATVNGVTTLNGNTIIGSDSVDTVTVNALVDGNITFAFNDTATPKGILGKTSTGAQDFWFVGGAEANGTSNSGYALIATGDDGTEPIYVRQYNGSPISGTVNKELTLLDSSGNTSLAGNLTVKGNGYIYSATGLAVLLNGANTELAGELKLGANTIKSSNNTTAIETTDTGDIIVGDDIFARGNEVYLNYGQSVTGNAGLVVNRYNINPLENAILRWNESSDRWQFTNDGTNYTNMPVAADTPTYAGLTISNNTTSNLVGITGTVANTASDNDYWFVGGYAINGETNNGAMVIATANNGNEPIYVRQYSGGGTIQQGTINRELTLLDANGDTTLAGNLNVTGQDISTNVTDSAIFINRKTESTNIARNAVILKTTSTTTPTVGFGTALAFSAQTALSTYKDAAYISVNSTDITTDSEDFEMNFGLMKDGVAFDKKMTLNSSGDLTTTGNLQVSGNTIKKSGGTNVITFTGTNLTEFAGDIKLGGDTIYDSLGNNVLDFRRTSTIYGTSYTAKFNSSVNYGVSASFVALDNIVEMNTSSLTTTATTTAVLDFFSPTSYRSAKYLIQISNGTAHQMWEGMVIHDGTDIFITAYGDIRTNGNLATVTVGFNATTGYAELRVTPVNATQTKFKATKTYIAV